MKDVKVVRHSRSGKLLEVVDAYVALKAKLDRIEAQMKEYRKEIEASVEVGEKVQVGTHEIILSACTRENFALSDAKRHIPAEVLAPFISTSSYNRLVVK